MTLVSRGHVRVDAEKAQDKLRAHLLVDRDLYATEVARAFAALGASRAALRWDADDVVLEAHGITTMPTAADLAAIRDHIATSPRSPIEIALRLLGVGIHAALDLDSSYVDLLTTTTRLRFAARSAPEAARIEPALGAGMLRVHVRQSPGLATLQRALAPTLPRPLRLLLDRAIAPPFTLTVNDVPTAGPAILLREPFPRSEATAGGSLDVLDRPDSPQAATSFCEYGFELARHPGIGTPRDAFVGNVPLRVVIDAPQLPTNASRSDVRLDDPFFVRELRKVHPALFSAVASLDPTLPEHQEALGQLAEWVADRVHAIPAPPPPLLRLLDLPLLLDAFGAPRSIEDVLRSAERGTLRTYGADEPLEAELAPLLRDTVWLRGRAAEGALRNVQAPSCSDSVARARLGLERRARVRGRTPREPAVGPTREHVFVESFRVESGAYAGLHGQVALRHPSAEPSRAFLFVDGQPLEIATVPGTLLSFELAFAWEGTLRATLDYTEVERTAETLGATAYAWSIAAALAVASDTLDDGVRRLALRSWLAAAKALGLPRDFEHLPRLIADAALWPCSDGTMCNARSFGDYVRARQTICITRTQRGAAPDGRPVLVLPAGDPLLALLPTSRAPVEYGEDLARSATPPFVDDATTSLPFEHGPIRGSIALGPPRLQIWHQSVCREDAGWLATYADVTLRIDDRGAIPSPFGTGLTYQSPMPDLIALEGRLLDHVLGLAEAAPLAVAAAVLDALHTARSRMAARLLLETGHAPLDSTKLVGRLAALDTTVREQRTDAAKARVLERAPVPAWPDTSPQGHHDEPGAGRVRARLSDVPSELVLVHGRPLGAPCASTLPLELVVDLQRDAWVDDSWTHLTPAGAAWARVAATRAAMALLDVLAARPDFTSHEPSLRLAVALLGASDAGIAVVRAKLVCCPWPRVLGAPVPLPTTLRQVRSGTVQYGGAAPVDQLELYVPDSTLGDLRRRLLQGLGVRVIDVSAELARLQALRGLDGAGLRFIDTLGTVHSLSRLLQIADVFYTTNQLWSGTALAGSQAPVLVLDADGLRRARAFAELQGGRRTLFDAGPLLEQDLAAQRKQQAETNREVALSTQQRAYCIYVATVKHGDLRLRGEIGLLAPNALHDRSIVVHAQGHYLCTLEGPEPSPTDPDFVAVVHLDRVRANRAYDGFEHAHDAERIRTVLLQIARTTKQRAERERGERDPRSDEVAQPTDAPRVLTSAAATSAPVAATPRAEPVLATPVPLAPAAVIELTEPVPVAPFFAGLWRRAVELVFPPRPPADAGVLEALAHRLAELRLTGAPVVAVVAVETGRPLVFERSGTLRVNVRDRSVIALHASETGMLHLLLAALSEINRELGAVTDAEERAVLQALLVQASMRAQ